MNTKKLMGIIVATSLMLIGVQKAMAIEEAGYVVTRKDEAFEVREYAPHVLAETLVEGDLEEAGSKAFKKLLPSIKNIRRKP